jgi:hypothetical protein
MGLPFFVDYYGSKGKLVGAPFRIVQIQFDFRVKWGATIRTRTTDDGHPVSPKVGLQDGYLAGAQLRYRGLGGTPCRINVWVDFRGKGRTKALSDQTYRKN